MKAARRQERIDEDFYRYRPNKLAVSRAVIGGLITMVVAVLWLCGGAWRSASSSTSRRSCLSAASSASSAG